MDYVTSLSHNGGVKYVQIGDLPSIQQNGNLSVSIPGFEATPHTFYAEQVDYKSTTEYTWIGKKSNDQGDFVFFANSVGKLGFIDLGTVYYSIFSLGGNLSVIMKHNMAEYSSGECGGINEEERSEIEYCGQDDCGSAVVDVLVLMTEGADTWISSRFGNFQDLYVQFATLVTINGGLALSGVPNKFVRTRVHLDYTPTFTLSPQDIANDIGELEAEQEQSSSLKYQYRADIVVMLTNMGYGVAGRANTIDPAAGAKYCIVEVPFVFDPRFTFAHEVAHLFGCDHDPNNASGVEEACAHGHILTLTGNVLRPTIMSRTNAVTPTDPEPRILRYSNPNIEFNGVATGVANSRDNARIMRASICTAAGTQISPELFVTIHGNTILCGPSGTISSNNTYTANILPPGTGFPGVPPYTYEWHWSPDGVFNPGTYLGAGSSVQINSVFNCPSFFLKVKVTSSDDIVATATRKIQTALCTACLPPNGLVVTSTNNLLDSKLMEWSVTPNPSDGVMTINVAQPLGHTSTLRFFNQQGVLLWELSVSGTDAMLMDVSNLSNGIYFLALANTEASSVQKIILQK